MHACVPPPLEKHPPPNAGELITALKAVGVWDVLAAVFLSRLKANKQRALQGDPPATTGPAHHEEPPPSATPSITVGATSVSGSAPPRGGGGSQTVGSWGARSVSQVASSLGATPSQASFKRPPRSPRPAEGHGDAHPPRSPPLEGKHDAAEQQGGVGMATGMGKGGDTPGTP